MSNTSLWVVGLNKRIQIQVEGANTPLYNILKQFCEKNDLDPTQYELQSTLKKGKALDLSLPFRLSGLSKNATVEVLQKQSTNSKSQSTGSVSIALQLPSGDRQKATLSANITLWEALIQFENQNGSNITQQTSQTSTYLQPVLTFMNQSFSTIESLKSTRLSGLGLNGGGSALLRLTLVDSKTSIQQVQERINSPVEQSNQTTQSSQPAPKKAKVEKVEQAIPSSSSPPPPPPQVIHPIDPAKIIPVEGTVATNIKIYKIDQDRPAPTIHDFNATDKDFELSRSELQQIFEADKKKREESMLFKSHKIKEMEAQKEKERVYESCIVRVRFTSGYILEGTFKPKNKLKRVEEFIQSVVTNAQDSFVIYQSPPVKKFVDLSLTLKEAGLVPAALINVKSQHDAGPFIKDDLIQKYSAVLPPMPVIAIPNNIKGTDQEQMVIHDEQEQPDEVMVEPPVQPVKEEKVSKPTPAANTTGKSTIGGVPKWFKRQ